MIPLICASPTNVLGLLTFIGWISGVPLLASVRAKYVPMAPSTAFCFSLIGVGLIAHLLRAALPWFPRLLRSNSRWKMLSARSSLRSNCTLPSLVTLAFQRRNFSTASSATSASFPNANYSTTMFVLWEWKCSTPVNPSESSRHPRGPLGRTCPLASSMPRVIGLQRKLFPHPPNYRWCWHLQKRLRMPQKND